LHVHLIKKLHILKPLLKLYTEYSLHHAIQGVLEFLGHIRSTKRRYLQINDSYSVNYRKISSNHPNVPTVLVFDDKFWMLGCLTLPREFGPKILSSNHFLCVSLSTLHLLVRLAWPSLFFENRNIFSLCDKRTSSNSHIYSTKKN
jgi:hypothetical protein